MSMPIHDGRTNDLYQTLAKCEDLNDMQLFLDRHSKYFTGLESIYQLSARFRRIYLYTICPPVRYQPEYYSFMV